MSKVVNKALLKQVGVVVLGALITLEILPHYKNVRNKIIKPKAVA